LKEKIKVGAVSYLNTKPLVYGFEQGMMKTEMDLLFDYPANVAQKLIDKTIDIGLVPVAVLPALKEQYIISDYCIGSIGEVASVCLFSDVALHEIEEILLDYQSKTSVALLKILLQQHWKIKPKLIAANEGFEKNISNKTAGLVIGDRAFTQRLTSKYHYDLGLAWQQMTGLPFVFAVWVSNKKLSDDFISHFNNATANGIINIDKVVALNTYNQFDMLAYYTKFISYAFNAEKKQALQHFLQMLPSNT
jgi:chorismate dehydratase